MKEVKKKESLRYGLNVSRAQGKQQHKKTNERRAGGRSDQKVKLIPKLGGGGDAYRV